MTKKPKADKRGGFPDVVYVRQEEDGGFRYFACGKHEDEVMHGVGDEAVLARYVYADRVNAKVAVKMEKKR